VKILILGVSGMLGHALFDVLSADQDLDVFGASRSAVSRPGASPDKLFSGVDVLNDDDMVRVMRKVQPDVVINAVGLIKQLGSAKDPLQAIPINALLPHRLSNLCALTGARFIQISTDCVFAGDRGGYQEAERPDATDLYGLSKFLGEVVDAPHAITLRTSIIGRELRSSNSLVDWFLAAGKSVKGYSNAVFSGLPTVVLADVIRQHVLPRPDLHGLYHVSVDAIDKAALLRLIAKVYGLEVEIEDVPEPRIDRSLNSDRFREATGYRPQPWPVLIERMRALQH
jgi:dTDP-4-dehydrorhamnose reductase